MTFKQCTINSKQYGFFNRSPTEMIETRSWENISKILEEKYGIYILYDSLIEIIIMMLNRSKSCS